MQVELTESEALLERATRVVPGGIYGHQSPALLVAGAYPAFFSRGAGSHIWDADGHEYIDRTLAVADEAFAIVAATR